MKSNHEDRHIVSVSCVILTISDTRTIENDASGKLIHDRLVQAGHRILTHEITPDDRDQVVKRVQTHCANSNCQCILMTGGTGIAPRDVTCEAVLGLLEKKLDGFGELFRMLSFQEIGPRAMLSRAVAGTIGRTMVFCMPGSTAAVQLAMDRLILPTLSHAVALLSTPDPAHHPI